MYAINNPFIFISLHALSQILPNYIVWKKHMQEIAHSFSYPFSTATNTCKLHWLKATCVMSSPLFFLYPSHNEVGGRIGGILECSSVLLSARLSVHVSKFCPVESWNFLHPNLFCSNVCRYDEAGPGLVSEASHCHLHTWPSCWPPGQLWHLQLGQGQVSGEMPLFPVPVPVRELEILKSVYTWKFCCH